jgi:hypothetical protein
LKCVASNNTFDCRRVARFGAQGHLGRGAAKSRNAPRSFYTAGTKPKVGTDFDGRYYMYGRYTYDINEPTSWVEGDQFTIGVDSSDLTTFNKWVLNSDEITESYATDDTGDKTIVENNFAAAYGTDTKRIVDTCSHKTDTSSTAWNWMIIEKFNGLFYTIGDSPVTKLITVKTIETKLLRLDDALNHIRSHPTDYVDDILDGTEPIVKISIGNDFVLVVLSNGRLWGYGNTEHGRMAMGYDGEKTTLIENRFVECTSYNQVIDDGWLAVDVSCFRDAAMVHFKKYGFEDRIFFHGDNRHNRLFGDLVANSSSFFDPSGVTDPALAEVWVKRTWNNVTENFDPSTPYTPLLSPFNYTILPFESKKLIDILTSQISGNYPVCEEIGASLYHWRIKIDDTYYGGGFISSANRRYGFSENEYMNTIHYSNWTDVVELDVLNLKITELRDSGGVIQVTRMLKNVTNISIYDLTTGDFYIIDNTVNNDLTFSAPDFGSMGYSIESDNSLPTGSLKIIEYNPDPALEVSASDNETEYGTHRFRQIPSMSLTHIDDNRVSTIGEGGFFRNINGTWDGLPGGTVRFVEYVPSNGCAFWITDNTNY